MPGDGRLGQVELDGELGEHDQAAVAEGGQGAGGPAELDGQAVPVDLGQPPPALVQADQPAGRLQAEGDRDRLLEQGPLGDQGAAVPGGQGGAGVGGAGQVVQQRPQRPPGDQHDRRVEHVLAGRAPMDVVGDPGREPVGELADQRHHRVAGGRRQRPQLGRVEAVGPGSGRRSPRRPRPGPARPWPALASAASVSSMAWSNARSSTSAATRPWANTPANKDPQTAKKVVACSLRRMSRW